MYLVEPSKLYNIICNSTMLFTVISKSTKRTSIKLYYFDITQYHSFIFLFMYLSELLQYFLSSNNLRLKVLKRWIFWQCYSNSVFKLSMSLLQKYKIYNLTWSTITSNYKKIIISIYFSCHQAAMLVLDLSPPSVVNTACLVLLNTFSHSARC